MNKRKKQKRFFLRYWDKLILSFLTLTYILTFSFLSVKRHFAFASNFDLSNMDNTMWNTLHGNFFSLRIADTLVSRFSIHSDLILVFLSPIYLVYDYTRALLITQSILIGLGALPVYFISVKLLKNRVLSLAVVLQYLLNPSLQWTNIYDFHGVSLAIPFLLSTFYFALVKKWKWYLVFALLSVITKEQISLVVALIGLVTFFVFKEKKYGAITFLGGILWFCSMVFIIMPYFSPIGSHWGFSLFSQAYDPAAGNQLGTIQHFNFNRFFDFQILEYYKKLLEPYGFTSLLGLPWILLSLPDLAINVLSYHRAMQTITYHYGSGIIPGLTIASIYGMSYVANVVRKNKHTSGYSEVILLGLTIVVLFFAIKFNYFYSPLPTTPSCWCFIYNVTDEDKAFKKVLNRIPSDAKVTASLEVRPHVNHRHEVYSVPSATPSADFIALITQNRIIGNYEPKEYENKLIPILLSNNTHEVLYKSKNFYLFRKKDSMFNLLNN